MLSKVFHGFAYGIVRGIWGDHVLILGDLKVFVNEPVVNIGIKEEDLGVKESALNLLFEVIYTCLYIMNQHIIIASVISVNLHFTAYIIDWVTKFRKNKWYREIFHRLENLFHGFELY
jgi:hypothetical protein